MKEITLNEILYAREQRVKKQKDIINSFNCPIISFTMNIAGPCKVSPLIERAFFEGIKLLKEKLSSKSILYENIEVKPTGCEAFFSVNKNAKEIKKITSLIEESITLGRLFDMDVIDTNFTKLERENPRSCIICKRKGKVCSAGRFHTAEEVFNKTKEIMEKHFKNQLSSLKEIKLLKSQSNENNCIFPSNAFSKLEKIEIDPLIELNELEPFKVPSNSPFKNT